MSQPYFAFARLFLLHIFPWLFMACGSLVVWIGARNVLRGCRARRWPRATGVVRKSRAVKKSSPKGAVLIAELDYEYLVNGITYSASNVAFGDDIILPSGYTQCVLTQFPTGREVSVFYDPAAPHIAVLVPGPSEGACFATGAGVLFIVAGIGASWLARQVFGGFPQ